MGENSGAWKSCFQAFSAVSQARAPKKFKMKYILCLILRPCLGPVHVMGRNEFVESLSRDKVSREYSRHLESATARRAQCRNFQVLHPAKTAFHPRGKSSQSCTLDAYKVSPFGQAFAPAPMLSVSNRLRYTAQPWAQTSQAVHATLLPRPLPLPPASPNPAPPYRKWGEQVLARGPTRP